MLDQSSWTTLFHFGRSAFRRISLILFLAAPVLFFLRNRHELQQLPRLKIVDPFWILLIFLAQAMVLLTIAWELRTLLRACGFPLSIGRLLRADLERFALSVAYPFGTGIGATMFATDLKGDGVPPEVSLLVVALYGLIGTLSFLLLLPLSAFFAAQTNGLPLPPLAVSIASLGLLTASAVLLALARHARKRLAGNRGFRARIANVVDLLGRMSLSTLVQVVTLALLVDGLNVVMLWCAPRVFGTQLDLQQALLLYQASYLFVFLIPFAQGAGVVELAGVLLLQRWGFDGAVAVGVLLLWRLHELYLPFLLGSGLALRRHPLVQRVADRFPALLLYWSGFVAIFGLLEPLRHRVHARGLERVGLLEPWEFSRHLELLLGFASILIAGQVWRRKRSGWFLAIVVLTLTVAQQLSGRRDPVVTVLSLSALVLLLTRWHRYRVRSDVPTLLRGLGFAAAGIVITFLYSITGLMALRHHAFSTPIQDWRAASSYVLRSALGLGHWTIVPRSRYGAWFLDSISVLSGAAVLNVPWSVGRPVVWRYRVHPAERQQARQVIEACGNSSLDFFKWWPDKWYFFSADKKAVISYRVYERVALVLGDPNGCTDDAWERVVEEFLELCEGNDWEPAFHQVSDRYLDRYRNHGLRSLKIGEEAVVDLESWSLTARGVKDLRYQVRRLERDGYRFEVSLPPLTDALLDELESVNREWLTVPGRRERYFTQGQFHRAYLRTTPVALLIDPGGQVVAFANVIPSGRPGEVTIDLMRRRREPYGAMTALLARLLEWSRQQGFRTFSLGLVPLVGLDLPVLASDPLKERFYRLFDRFFSVQGLYHFKNAFHPRWEPRYLVYRSPAALPQIVLVLVRATEGRRATKEFTPELAIESFA